MERIVELNRSELLGARPSLERIDAVPAEAVVVDVRPTDAFTAGHHPGAVGIPVSGSSFATRAAFVLPERPVVLHASHEEEAVRAARSLHTVALFETAGWQEGGGSETLEPVSLEELERLLADDAVELRTARAAAEAGLLNGRPVVTICESGPRAAIAASVLQAAGVNARPVLDGGIADWRARGGETTSFRRCGS